MTIESLIDYLSEFPPNARVFLSEDDIDYTEDFSAGVIYLDVLDFSSN